VSKSRESGFTEDVRVDRIVGANDLASRGNAAMRAALDLAFVSGPGNIEKARRLSQESIDAFGQRLALSKQRIRALELLDTVRAELPYLTAWWVEESRHAARQPGDLESSSLRTKPADIVALLLAVEQLGRGRVLPPDAMERLLESPFAQVAADVLDRLTTTTEGVGDQLIGPARPVSVGLEQDLGAANLLTGALELPDNLGKLLTFRICQTNHIDLAHASRLAQSRRKAAGQEEHRQSQGLDVTKH